MKLDLSNNCDVLKSEIYLTKLVKEKSQIELKKINSKRTLKQNAYLHVLITLFGIEFGYTIEESKTLLKRECHFMRYEKKGSTYLRRTRDLDKRSQGELIDWIRNYSSIRGLYLPTSEEYISQKFNIDRTIDSHKQYL